MEIILFLAAIAVAFLIFTWLVKIARTTISTALTIALIVLILLAFGIGPAQLWQEMTRLFQYLWNLVTGNR
ncbi:hypothetical protein J5X98_02285 [Leptothermofonsia sichuanensis E412]|uniref:hypothetical protein n=1 Tax=Leptothermofonsia sichuanensis TaxID=2917832 RepID=UPI001CA75117|nr:hypothetical protein [Leptothermofonsia sichuanensis]QZZ21335.1 hypothetical protein J5X98_02285 [Leptothermofonsia sichuanensis E412]